MGTETATSAATGDTTGAAAAAPAPGADMSEVLPDETRPLPVEEAGVMRARADALRAEVEAMWTQQERLARLCDRQRAALDAIQDLCAAQGEDSYVMVHALRAALRKRSTLPPEEDA